MKPPSEHYKNLPELEDLSMHLAAIAGIKTVSHSLIRLKSGELSYITKRIDRKGKQKFHMEDMCQLTERLSEAKYRGSYEQIGKALVHYSANPGFDIPKNAYIFHLSGRRYFNASNIHGSKLIHKVMI